MAQIDPTVTALFILIINGGLLWIREWKKHRTWRTNGTHLNEIKAKLHRIDRKIGKQAARCTEVTDDFRSQLKNHGKRLNTIASSGRK